MFIYCNFSNFINIHYLNYKSDIVKLIVITLMYITTYIYIHIHNIIMNNNTNTSYCHQ